MGRVCTWIISDSYMTHIWYTFAVVIAVQYTMNLVPPILRFTLPNVAQQSKQFTITRMFAPWIKDYPIRFRFSLKLMIPLKKNMGQYSLVFRWWVVYIWIIMRGICGRLLYAAEMFGTYVPDLQTANTAHFPKVTATNIWHRYMMVSAPDPAGFTWQECCFSFHIWSHVLRMFLHEWPLWLNFVVGFSLDQLSVM